MRTNSRLFCMDTNHIIIIGIVIVGCQLLLKNYLYFCDVASKLGLEE